VTAPVQHLDIVPTLLDLAGAPARAELRGRSLRPLLEGTGTLPETGIYSEALYSRYHFGWSELYGLTDARYRFIRAPRDELYDIARDPKETASIVTERPQVRQAMRTALEALVAHAPIGAPSAVTDEDRRRLAALGYVGAGAGTSLSLPGDSLADPKDKVQVLEKYRRATELAADLRFAEATALYREVLHDDPGMTDVWLQLAEVYTRQGMQAEAAGAFKEILKRNPKDAGSLIGVAASLLRLGRLDEARKQAALAVGAELEQQEVECASERTLGVEHV
jgi:tetratricopeptide (TPR) repeat protein